MASVFHLILSVFIKKSPRKKRKKGGKKTSMADQLSGGYAAPGQLQTEFWIL